MYTSATNKTISDLMVDYSEGKLVPNPDFQRRLVWTNKDKISFIKTILDGYPFPEIFIAKGDMDIDTGKSIIWIIDGQQRVTTIYEYFSDSTALSLPKSMPKYKDLSNKEKLDFLNYKITVRDLGSVSIEEVKELFRRINATSYNLNPMEINNAFYNGALKKLADSLLDSEFLEGKYLFTVNDYRRMHDTLFALNLIITCMSDYYQGNTSVEKYLIQYNNAMPREREYKSDFEKILKHIHEFGFRRDCRVWNKADFLTLFVELYRGLIKKRLDIDFTILENNLKSFYADVSSIVERLSANNAKAAKNDSKLYKYYEAALQGSSSKRSREIRGEIVFELIEQSTKP